MILNWFKRHWILSIFLLVGGVPAGLNYSGFCWEQKRWLSDEEFLLAMLGYEEESAETYEHGGKERNEGRKIFLKENPDCCIFDRGYTEMIDGAFIGFLYRIFGVNYASGQTETKRTDEDRKQNGWANDYYQSSWAINACGGTDFLSGWTMNEEEHRENYERYLRIINKQ